MRPAEILQRFVLSGCAEIHKARRDTLAFAAEAVITANSVIPAEMGRAIASDTTPKHGIKRIDRLLGNKHLHAELPVVYRQIAEQLLDERPIILVDWAKLDGHNQALLSAAVVHEGRAIPIYQEVHPMNLLANPDIEEGFMDLLKREVVPEKCRPIIVTDQGFQNPWFLKILTMGWDFVGRANLRVLSKKPDEKEWALLSSRIENKVHKPKNLGVMTVAKGNPLEYRVISTKAPPKGRKGALKADRKGIHPAGCTYKAYRRRAKVPAALVTSLEDRSAAQIERIYATRMQIEETFRTAKSHRFGWSQEHTRSKDDFRLEVIFLLATLAMLVQVLIGDIAERLGFARHFQANTCRSRRVLSLFTLGGMILERADFLSKLGYAWLHFAIKQAVEYSSNPLMVRALEE